VLVQQLASGHGALFAHAGQATTRIQVTTLSRLDAHVFSNRRSAADIHRRFPLTAIAVLLVVLYAAMNFSVSAGSTKASLWKLMQLACMAGPKNAKIHI